MVFLVNLPLLLESAIFCWQRKALKFEPKLGEGEQWLSSRSCDACPVAPVFEMLKQVWLFSSLGIVNACLQREHIAKVWTIFQWDQSSLNLHDAKRLGRRVESSVNRPAVLSLCIPPPPTPICVTVQRQVSDCLAGAKETPSELTAFPNDKFSFHFLHSLHRGSYSLKFFVISFRQWLLKKDKSATLWWAITHASVSSSPWRLHGNCTQKLMQRGSLKYPKGHSLSRQPQHFPSFPK